MDLTERLEWLFIGGAIGFILGFIVAKLSDIRDDVHDIKEELNTMERSAQRIKDERGSIRRPTASGIALAVVVALAFVSAVLSQQASNKSNDTSDRVVTIQLDQKQNLDCTTQVLFDVVAAVNSRTTYTTDQTNSNIELIKAQLEFLTRFSDEPPPTDEEAIQVYNQYVAAVTAFLTLAEKTRDQQIQNPYPTVEDLTTCLKQTNADTKEPSQ